MASKGYLVLYNLACAAGWSFIIYEMAQHFMAAPKGDYWQAASTLYPRVEKPLKIVQTAAILEIVHSMVGLVRSPVATTFMQVFSRLFILWGITNIAPASQTHWCFALMCASWASVEPPRYFFYLVKLLGSVPGALTWLRYSLFIILYPTGITGECNASFLGRCQLLATLLVVSSRLSFRLRCFLFCSLAGEVLSLWHALPLVEKSKIFSFSLPNAWNIAFSYHYFLLFILIGLYPFGSWVMYSHMLRQRRKELSPAVADGKKAQ